MAKLNQEIIGAMEKFALRVLKGGDDVDAQETAILPQVLETLEKNGHHEDDIRRAIEEEYLRIKQGGNVLAEIERLDRELRWYTPRLAKCIKKEMLALAKEEGVLP